MEIKSNNTDNIAIADLGMANSLIPYSDASEYKSKALIKIEKTLKRILDIIAGICGFIVLIPMAIILFIANFVIGDKGSLFYIQKRIGKDGKIFKMYKFRSMVKDADRKLEKYLNENEEARIEYKIYKKLRHDPRVTKVGKFIRKTSIDEFPQFINVLKGDMSLVGPRPYLEREKEDMTYYYKYITSCKPGITGLWQVSGRSDVTFSERMKLDMDYFHNHGIRRDVKIITKTVENIVKKEGAM